MTQKPTNQWLIFRRAFNSANRLWGSVVTGNLGTLLAIGLFVQVQAQFFLYFGKVYQFDQTIQLISQLGSGALALVEAIFLVMLVPLRYEEIKQNKPRTSFWIFFKEQIGPLTIEGIRMTAFVILWGLLLIIPGVFKQLRWYFMPFVVMFDPAYKSEEVDCLARSNELVKGITPLIFGLALVDFLVQMSIDNFSLSVPGIFQEISVFIAGFLTLGVSIYTYLLFYDIYKQRSLGSD